MRRTIQFAVMAGLAGVVLLSSQTSAQIKKGKERPLQTRHLMAGLLQPNCASLGMALQGSGPADAAGWDKASANAEILNEAGHVLMADGRCPDATWATAAQKLRDCSAAALKAIEEKNAEAGRTAFGELTSACAACHTAHRKK